MQGGLGGATAVLRSPREQLPQSGAGLDPPQLWQECPCVLFGGRKAETAIFSSCVAQPFLCQCEGLGGSRPHAGMCQVTLYFGVMAADKVSRNQGVEGEHAPRGPALPW